MKRLVLIGAAALMMLGAAGPALGGGRVYVYTSGGRRYSRPHRTYYYRTYYYPRRYYYRSYPRYYQRRYYRRRHRRYYGAYPRVRYYHRCAPRTYYHYGY